MTNMPLMPMQSIGAIVDPAIRTLKAFGGKYWWLLAIAAIAMFLFNYYKSRLQNSTQPTTSGVASTIRHGIGALSFTAKLGLLVVMALWSYVTYAAGIFPDVFAFIGAFDPFVIGTLAAAIAPIWAALGNVLTVPTVGTGDGPWLGMVATVGVFALVFGTVVLADYVYFVWTPDAGDALGDAQPSATQGLVYAAGLVAVGAVFYDQTVGLSISLDQLVLPGITALAIGGVLASLYVLNETGGIRGE